MKSIFGLFRLAGQDPCAAATQTHTHRQCECVTAANDRKCSLVAPVLWFVLCVITIICFHTGETVLSAPPADTTTTTTTTAASGARLCVVNGELTAVQWRACAGVHASVAVAGRRC